MSLGRPHVLVTHPLVEGGLDPLAGQGYEVTVARGIEDPAELRRAVREVDALLPLLTVQVREEVLQAAPRLRVVANCAVGYDNIDLPAATRRGIWVTNTPGVLTEATADLTWAALLAVARRVVAGDALMRGGGFSGWSPTLLLGAAVAGKTLGVIGLGQIGRAVARRAAGFSMRVLHHSIPDPGDVELGGLRAISVDLDTLLARSDFVTLHVPLSAETHHLLDGPRLRLMRPGAYLINTARGPVVDEQALVAQLRVGGLAGAALDVYEHEPALAPGLAELPSVLLLPHIGSATHETRLAMARMAAANIVAALGGEVPPNAVNPEAGEKVRGAAAP